MQLYVHQVLAGQHELAVVLWSKAEAPLRAALMASQLCQRLANNPALRADSDELGEQSIKYEDLAIELLDAVRESDDAVPLVTLLPWEWGKDVREDKTENIRELLWENSALDSAAEEDGLLSLPCMRFVAHRHCQHTLDKYFSGDFPGSKARIPPASSPLAIAAQALLPFAPGTVVEVMPVDLLIKPNVALRGKDVEKLHHTTIDDEMDPDLMDALDAIKKAASAYQAEKNETDENTWRDLFEDLTSMRWLQFYDVPKVKFVLNFFVYLGYMLYAAFTLVHYDVAKGAISQYEIFLWVWAISREVGEFFELDAWSLSGLRMYTPLGLNTPIELELHPLHSLTAPHTPLHPLTGTSATSGTSSTRSPFCSSWRRPRCASTTAASRLAATVVAAAATTAPTGRARGLTTCHAACTRLACWSSFCGCCSSSSTSSTWVCCSSCWAR